MVQVIAFAVLFVATAIAVITELVFGIVWVTKRLRHTPISKTGLRLRRSTAVLGCLLTVLLGFAAISQFSASTPPIRNEHGDILDGSIAELTKVKLNGRNEWISIRGNSRQNPVLLFLAGGPGGTQMAAVRHGLSELEKHFVVVNWDQPGSGKSYYATDREGLTVNTYIEDGYALTEYLCNRFQQDKIYLVGESWGSALGIFLASEHPERYHAFVGTGQMVDFLETENLDYDKAMAIAQARNDAKKIAKLEANGRPPYYGSDVTWKSAEYLNYLSSYMIRNPEIHGRYNTVRDILSPEYGMIDKINYVRGIINTFGSVYPQLYDTDLREDYPKLDVPVHFFIGRHDINAPTALVEDYYTTLESPRKELIWFEHSGHSPWTNESQRFVQELIRIAEVQ